MNVTDYKARLAKTLDRTMLIQDDGLSGYPVDVIDIIRIVCHLWHLRPPETRKSKALWIQDARELQDACGELGMDAVVTYRRDFEDYMRAHAGVAQHTVSGPGSLVKMVRATAAKMREVPQERGYLDGDFARFIEH